MKKRRQTRPDGVKKTDKCHFFNLKNQRGQLAIFVALIFQVLFVFFAMAINVSLIVHDKINLQNATDLAAYYAAQRQAEMLNAMAHVNYQIRQSYKLLAWRYRVLSTTGIQNPMHPSSLPPNAHSETEWNFGGITHKSKFPKICVNFDPGWIPDPGTFAQSAARGENICKSTNLSVPEIPEAQNLAPFLPLNFIVQQFSRELRKRFDASCDDQGIWNWWFMKSMKWAYRMDQANRRSLIMALSNNLARGAENIVDLDGNKIVDGVRVTLQKNLSWSQSQTQPSIKYFNSMTGIAQENWLREIYINPFFYWLDFDTRGNLGCRATSNGKQYFEFPFNIAHPDWGFINNNLDGGVLQSDTAEPDSGPYRLTIGYEKNPWVMVYSAVEARTTTRNIFHPFGPPIELRARSYAKPFGGRMGPWYADQWPSGAQESTGQKVDIRGQPRVGWADGLLANKDDPDRFPNYSRFPGDPLGLASVLAQSASTNLRNQFQGSLDFYFDVYSSHVLGGTNDPLAWNRKLNNGNIRPRMYEIAAIAPDLFDITYYSIDPNYWGNYGSRIERARQALGLPEDLPVRADLGSRGGVDELRNFSVQQQMELANRPDLRTNDAFYYIRNKVHLLTGWLPGPQANTYFPAEGQSGLPVGDSKFPFGMCPKPDYSTDPSQAGKMPTNPGSCIRGGRVGYSVKIISRDYLLSQQHNNGRGNKGPIINPPSFVVE